jgi:hypothetical protein
MMISIWHLLWIVPLSAMSGFLTASLCAIAAQNTQDEPINKPPVNP